MDILMPSFFDDFSESVDLPTTDSVDTMLFPVTPSNPALFRTDEESVNEIVAPRSKRKKTTVRPWKEPKDCPVAGCSRTYRARGDLKRHLMDAHDATDEFLNTLGLVPRTSREGKAWQCPVVGCPHGYNCKRDLRRHTFQKHNHTTGVFDVSNAKREWIWHEVDPRKYS